MKKIKIFALLTMLCNSTISSFSTNVDSLWVIPNPFNAITIIHFDIVQDDTISLDVLNLLGQNVKTFFQNAILPSGSYSINFQDDNVPIGIYMVRLKINSDTTLFRKIIKSGVGINDNEIVKPKQFIYPNPTTGFLTIPYDGTKTIIVTDLNGRIVKSLTINTKTVSLFDLNNGTYIVTILSDKGQIFLTQKIEMIK